METAEKHFAQAGELQPEYPGLGEFRLLLAAAEHGQRHWDQALAHLEHYAAYARTLSDRRPGSVTLCARYKAIQDRITACADFRSCPASRPRDGRPWIGFKGSRRILASFKGKVVLLDFFAVWANPSRQRMEWLKQLHAKFADQGLEIIGVTFPYKHRWNAETDQVVFQADLPPQQERANVAAFAERHGIPWRLAVIDETMTAEYGVATLPHSVAIDKEGTVQGIIQAANEEEMAAFEEQLTPLLAPQASPQS